MTWSVGWKPFTRRRDVASVRLRSRLPAKLLGDRGWHTSLYEPDRRYDAVVFQKAYEDSDIELARVLARSGVRTVFDLCDNHFDNAPEERVQRLTEMMASVDVLTVSTPVLAELVPRPDAMVIPDALDIPPRGISLRRRSAGRPNVVWYGVAGTTDRTAGLVDLKRILPDLAAAGARLTVITNSREAYDLHIAGGPVPSRFIRWRRSTFSLAFRGHDACVIPVSDNPFTRCKSNNRLVLALMLGVPVVADPIPSYVEFADHVLFDAWQASLDSYTRDHALRKRHLDGGRRFIRAHYGNEVVAGRWASVLDDLIRRPSSR